MVKTFAYKKVIDQYGNRLRDIRYDIIALPYSYNELIIGTIDPSRQKRYYIIPVKKASGYAIKINKRSVSNESGTAEEALKTLSIVDCFLRKIAENIIFTGNIKQTTIGGK